MDGAGNAGAQSAVAAATTADATAPSTPALPTATATGGTSVQVSWSSVPDNVATVGYHVYRDGSLAATVTGATTAAVSGLTSATTYRFTVDAFDAAGNASGQSPPAQVTTADTTAPTRPTGLTATAAGATQINLAWTATTDNVGVAGYHVYRAGVLVATLGSVTAYQDKALAPRTTYRYTIDAFDAAGNLTAQTASVSATTAADTTAPAVPGGLTATTSGAKVVLARAAASDNVKVTGYWVYRNGVRLASTTSLTWTDSGVQGSTYAYTVDAYDAAANRSSPSPAVSVKVPDVTAPSKPSGLTLTALTKSIALRLDGVHRQPRGCRLPGLPGSTSS